MTGLILCHLVDGVVDSVEVQSLSLLGQVHLAGAGAALGLCTHHQVLLGAVGAEFTVTSDAAVLRQADRVLLPGVGEASSAMAKLRERGLDALIPTLTQPVLGICIGMQLMCLDSEEGDTRCLGIFPAHVVRLRGGENPLKIPHVGWDTVGRLRSPLFDGLGEGTYLYYVHSYAAQACDATIAQTDYGGIFSAALGRGNFFGTQFHPEKRGRAGERILRNFLNL